MNSFSKCRCDTCDASRFESPCESGLPCLVTGRPVFNDSDSARAVSKIYGYTPGATLRERPGLEDEFMRGRYLRTGLTPRIHGTGLTPRPRYLATDLTPHVSEYAPTGLTPALCSPGAGLTPLARGAYYPSGLSARVPAAYGSTEWTPQVPGLYQPLDAALDHQLYYPTGLTPRVPDMYIPSEMTPRAPNWHASPGIMSRVPSTYASTGLTPRVPGMHEYIGLAQRPYASGRYAPTVYTPCPFERPTDRASWMRAMAGVDLDTPPLSDSLFSAHSRRPSFQAENRKPSYFGSDPIRNGHTPAIRSPTVKLTSATPDQKTTDTKEHKAASATSSPDERSKNSAATISGLHISGLHISDLSSKKEPAVAGLSEQTKHIHDDEAVDHLRQAHKETVNENAKLRQELSRVKEDVVRQMKMHSADVLELICLRGEFEERSLHEDADDDHFPERTRDYPPEYNVQDDLFDYNSPRLREENLVVDEHGGHDYDAISEEDDLYAETHDASDKHVGKGKEIEKSPVKKPAAESKKADKPDDAPPSGFA